TRRRTPTLRALGGSVTTLPRSVANRVVSRYHGATPPRPGAIAHAPPPRLPARARPRRRPGRRPAEHPLGHLRGHHPEPRLSRRPLRPPPPPPPPRRAGAPLPPPLCADRRLRPVAVVLDHRNVPAVDRHAAHALHRHPAGRREILPAAPPRSRLLLHQQR